MRTIPCPRPFPVRFRAAAVLLGLLAPLVLGGCGTSRRSTAASAEPVSTPAESPVVHAPAQAWSYPESPAVPEGMTVEKLLKQVTFPAGSASLNAEAMGALGQAVENLRTNSAWHVLIVGFADARGETTRASALSGQRADAVRAFLRGRGIAAERLHVQGLGSAHAKAGEYEAMQLELDRRAEVWAVRSR